MDVLVAEMPDVDYVICGSWRRGAPTIGDLDIVICTPDGTMGEGDLFNPGLQLPSSFRPVRRGEKTAFGDFVIGDEEFHGDFWSCAPNEKAAMVMFATGPMALNLIQRQHALRNGYRLSQVGLQRSDTHAQVDDGSSEELIYKTLGLDYLTPADRERFAHPKG